MKTLIFHEANLSSKIIRNIGGIEVFLTNLSQIKQLSL